jgi:hypothetical protein
MIISQDDHSLGNNLDGDMLTFCDLLCTKGLRMMLKLERYLMLTQVYLQSLFALHGSTSSVFL